MYKAKGLRPKDELDFQAALPLLSAEARDEIGGKLGELEDAKTLVGLLLYLHQIEAGDAHKVG